MLEMSADMPNRLSERISDLNHALKNLEEHNKQFISTNPEFITVKDCFDTALHEADAHPDITQGCHVLSKGILSTLRILEAKRAIKKDKWITKVGNFLKKIYPIARLSLSLASAVAGVSPDFALSEPKGVPFPYLKGSADALSIILQVSWDCVLADQAS